VSTVQEIEAAIGALTPAERRRLAEDLPRLVPELDFASTEAGGAPNLRPEEVAELRGKLAAWEKDWNAPGMEAYDAL